MLRSGFPLVIPAGSSQITVAGLRLAFRALLDAAERASARLLSRTERVERYAFHFEHILGTSFELQLVATSARAARRAEAAALAEIDRLDAFRSERALAMAAQ